ncbi:Spo0E family sporulation regulatory protein-aspartic acid phosphatase [Sporomusa sp.]|uniref:Spo0E family sporulation regulatory protein-aspartic acid phosphatase n=1 Tax=Sporomusa sp. TaxID=2078658 RepID=UPI0039C91835
MDNTELCRLSEKIEVLREQLHKQAEKVGIAHPAIMKLSRRLDKLIYRYILYTHNPRYSKNTSAHL